MASSTIEEQVGRLLAPPPATGADRVARAATALAEASMALLARPRGALYLYALARNGLTAAADRELTILAAILEDLADVANPRFAITDLRRLREARLALLGLDALDTPAAESVPFRHFDRAVSQVLEIDLAPSVRRPRRTALARSAEEARADLTADLARLALAHEDLLDRLYALAVGVDNFLTGPLSARAAAALIGRVRSDVEEAITAVEDGTQAVPARDLAVRLLGGRAALRQATTPQDIRAPVLSSANALPPGHTLSGTSAPASALATSLPGPFTFASGDTVSITVGATTVGPYDFPQRGIDLGAMGGFVFSLAVPTYPVVVPVNSDIYLVHAGTTTRVQVGSGSYATYATLETAIAAALTTYLPDVEVVQYAGPGSSRLLLYSGTGDALAVAPSYVNTLTGQVYTNSIASLLELATGDGHTALTAPVVMVRDYLQVNFSSLVTTSPRSDFALSMASVVQTPGVVLTITAPSSLGLAGAHSAVSTRLRLRGTVYGEVVDPVDPRALLDVGDDLTTPSGTARVAELSQNELVLDTNLSTFDGVLEAESALLRVYDRTVTSLEGEFLPSWTSSPFASGVSAIEAACALPFDDAPLPSRARAEELLAALVALLNDLVTRLRSADLVLPEKAGSRERTLIEDLLGALSEQGMDRAVDLLLRCRIQEALLLDADGSSHASEALRAMGDFARADVAFPTEGRSEPVSVSTREGA